MSEVEKMYKNAGVEKRAFYNGCPKGQHLSNNLTCYECEYFSVENPYLKCSYRVYPPFTAEKQIAIIKLISKQGQVIIENWEKDNRGFNVTFRANSNLRYITMDCITRKTVEEALAQIVNDIWQDLTEEEQEQIRRILNG